MDRVLKEIIRTLLLTILACALAITGLFNSTGEALTYGDVNNDGVVNVLDVVLVMRDILDLEPLGGQQKELADVNGDGVVDVRDAALLMQKSLGVIDYFPGLDHDGAALIEEFFVEEGLVPGKKLVIVILKVADPEDYRVKAGESELEYRASIEGFRGEAYEDEARLSRIRVYKED